jgi:hypothetical protein
MRIVGALNVLFAALALSYLEEMLRMHWNKWPSSATTRDWVVFAFLLTISVYLVVHLAYLGVRLIEKHESALLLCTLLFATETLGAVLSVWAWWGMHPASMNKVIFGLWWIALSPIDVEVFSGYSILGLVATLSLLFSRKGVLKTFAGDAASPGTVTSG